MAAVNGVVSPKAACHRMDSIEWPNHKVIRSLNRVPATGAVVVREPDERAAICVVSALEGQSIPWALQHILIASVADEIRAVIADERAGIAATLELDEANEESLTRLRDLAREMKAAGTQKTATTEDQPRKAQGGTG